MAEVWNLIWQRAQLFYQLEAAKIIKAYIAHNMDDNKNFHTRLETTESEVTTTRKLIEEKVGLLRKVEEGNEAIEAEACQLAEEMETMEISKKKVDEKARRLR